jgi:hypothetical protein
MSRGVLRRRAEYDAALVHADRRPDVSEFDSPLTKAQLAELERHLSFLSPDDVVQTYRRAHQRCCMQGELLPGAEAVQETVVAWKVMRKWKRTGPARRD